MSMYEEQQVWLESQAKLLFSPVHWELADNPEEELEKLANRPFASVLSIGRGKISRAIIGQAIKLSEAIEEHQVMCMSPLSLEEWHEEWEAAEVKPIPRILRSFDRAWGYEEIVRRVRAVNRTRKTPYQIEIIED